jgi:hypothetical protein
MLDGRTWDEMPPITRVAQEEISVVR